MVLLSKLLVPGTSDFITGKEAALTEDMSTLCLVNWASFIFDDIAIAAKLWRSKKSCTNPSMHGCLMFLLVYYLDNLLGEHSTDPELTPRIAHVTKQQILDLIEEDKQVVNGVETFGALPLRSQQGTCYMENTSSSTYDPPETADIPSASHSFPSTFFPSMQHHLAGCFNHLPAEEQIAANDALRRCDEDVGKLTLQISTNQMSAIQEIRRILCDGQSRTRPPSPPDGRGTANPVTTDTPLRATHIDPSMEAAQQRQPPSPRAADEPNVLLHKGHNIEADNDVTDALSFTQIIMGDGFDKLSNPSMEAAQQRQPPSPRAADEPNVLLHKGHNIEADNDVTDALSFTQIIMGDGFDKLSSTQQADFIDEVFGDPNRPPYNSHHQPNYDSPQESPYDSPQESHYDSPHEILTNGVCKTCYELDDICSPDEDLLNDEGDADTLASDPSFQGLHNESSPLPPPVFDKTPHTWNKLPYSPSPVFDKTPTHNRHGTESLAPQEESLHITLDRDEVSDVCVKKTTTKISRPKISTRSSKVAFSRKSRNKVLHSRIVYYGTQPPKTSRRNNHMSSKLLSPFKSPPNKGSCHIPLDSALALHDIVISDKRLMDVPLISNASLGVCSRGEALASSFKDNASTLIEIMNFFTECLRHDEKLLAPQCRGYRLFLSWTFGSLLNCEELLPGQVYDGSMSVKYLSEHLNGVDHKQIKLILWTYHHSNHFSVYCVNRVNTRIDVLDSIDWSKNGGSFEERNDPCGYRSIERLSDAFQTLTGKQFEDFSKWPIWSKEVPRQLPLGNSCASFTKKFLRHYDGEESLLRCSIEPAKENQYRAEDLSYLIFHDLNQIRPLPDSLEKFRPMLTHM
uniref:Uncharacterized protein n=1 Tax=Avena sativa TaxID=4498 RepID=A0ACD5T8S1_AVESA